MVLMLSFKSRICEQTTGELMFAKTLNLRFDSSESGIMIRDPTPLSQQTSLERFDIHDATPLASLTRLKPLDIRKSIRNDRRQNTR